MSKQIKAHPIRHNDPSIGAREIALAGLGAASLARKQAVKSFAEFSAFANRLPEASAILVEGLGERTQALKDTVVAKAVSLRKRAGNVAQIASGELEQRIAPLLARLGVKNKPAKRKPVASKGRAKAKRKNATKRTSRKAA
jgi:hypothetical protein